MTVNLTFGTESLLYLSKIGNILSETISWVTLWAIAFSNQFYKYLNKINNENCINEELTTCRQ